MFFDTKNEGQSPQTKQLLGFPLHGQEGAVTTVVLGTLTPVTYN